MTLDAESIVDRRRLKRRLAIWRLGAIVAVVGAVIAIVFASSEKGLVFGGRDQIAAFGIDGLITGQESRVKLIRKLGETGAVKAVIVRIDSPGGTTAGSEALYEELRQLAGKKPVVAVLQTVAASGGYIAALAADHIVARGNTVTGSIGVIFQWADVQEALASLGIEVEEIKSGPLKAEPSLFSDTSNEARIVAAAMVRDGFDWFVGLVADRRPFDLSTARSLSDGRVYTGRQAIAARLIDKIGGDREAREWLETERGIEEGLKIVEWGEDDAGDIDLVSRAVAAVAGALGLPVADNAALGLTVAARAPKLDGLLSLWHPKLLN